MVRRKNFVSDGLVTLRHKDRGPHSDGLAVGGSGIPEVPEPDMDKNLSFRDRQLQIYHQTKNDLDVRLHEQLAVLEAEIAAGRQELTSREAAYEKFQCLLDKFAGLPAPAELEEDSEAAARLEQLRLEFFRTKAGSRPPVGKGAAGPAPAPGQPPISLLPELNSLGQLQMLKMGLCFALPLIISIIAGCGIIAWVIIFMWGG
ncbi:MAG: hypothetical protein PHH77_04655 [Victivallaceae bacterium]|nr:hypothetical protein [Victivallaceae bacterium]